MDTWNIINIVYYLLIMLGLLTIGMFDKLRSLWITSLFLIGACLTTAELIVHADPLMIVIVSGIVITWAAVVSAIHVRTDAEIHHLPPVVAAIWCSVLFTFILSEDGMLEAWMILSALIFGTAFGLTCAYVPALLVARVIRRKKLHRQQDASYYTER